MKRERPKKIRSLFSWRDYALIFIAVCFVLTANVYLLLGGMNVHWEDVKTSAFFVMGNVFFIALILTVANGFFRKQTVEKPVLRILEATEEISNGNFNVRLDPVHSEVKDYNEFDLIIENFNLMAKELSQTEILRTDFISNVSHELKSPLASIQNYAVLLQDPALSEEKRLEYVRAIQSSSARFASLITNILKLNKLENQSIFANLTRFDLSEQLCACMLDFETVWEKKKIEIDTDIEQDIFIESDEELLSLVWNNLLSNALKFTDEGGRVSLKLKREGSRAVITVSDTGCGISEEAKDRIFEKFYQGDTSHSSAGNGLGLALVKKVIDIVGGSIEVESREGEGSVFTVDLAL